jgi:hypothetical protein
MTAAGAALAFDFLVSANSEAMLFSAPRIAVIVGDLVGSTRAPLTAAPTEAAVDHTPA